MAAHVDARRPSGVGAGLAPVWRIGAGIEQSEQLAQRSRALEGQLQGPRGAGIAGRCRAGRWAGRPAGQHALVTCKGGIADDADAAGFEPRRGTTPKKPPLSGPTRQLGARVLERRLALGLSQQSLAERAGLHWLELRGADRTRPAQPQPLADATSGRGVMPLN